MLPGKQKLLRTVVVKRRVHPNIKRDSKTVKLQILAKRILQEKKNFRHLIIVLE